MLICNLNGLLAQNIESALLYRIEHPETEQVSHLYGTIHLIRKEYFSIPPKVQDALDNSDRLILEIDLNDDSTFALAGLASIMPDDKSIEDFLSKKEINQISDFYRDSISIAESFFYSWYTKMKPITHLSSILNEMIQGERDSYDAWFAQWAKENAIPISGLETTLQQVMVFDSIPYEIAFKEILRLIDEFDSERELFNDIQKAYVDQNIQALNTMLQEESGAMGEYDHVLLDARNQNWIAKLDRLMQEEACFIAVGAGHLYGEQGLLELLQKEGYKVYPIEY